MEERLKKLENPEKASWGLIITGYFFAILHALYFFIPSLYYTQIFYKILPLIIALIVFWSLIYLKKTLPNEKQINMFDKNSQIHGVCILILLIIGALKILYDLFTN